ncbi:carboxypeptidase-like regulatory domain-containing protein [Blastopirellula sp. JC732]|uniref:Carboxypeptidase-like regulatory domain-containing protein n=1 Tax=Blastopirellula sediminis TaxID=2894196 RepID=A0A9X1SHW1_9BACT|nr:carboxypeptidase-like regulatory domain-containing protein [Blastopirellula sediminis]MCC9605040.1 carboxypeptidase-like regulatory domain-containing protein [Blastopirellula sediminis]MCC9631660.1 carboxypeptidase-like regulatory domain-containing protein [Blastopirellula sediminis]
MYIPKIRPALVRTIGLLLVCCPAFFGCDLGANGPGTVPVTGKITYRGQPVPAAIVQFKPNDGDASHGAVGRSDAEGAFQMTTREFAGVVPGTYQITVVKYDAKTPEASTKENEEEEYTPPDEHARPTPGPKNVLPAKYANADKSGLTAEVTPSGPNEVVLELVD